MISYIVQIVFALIYLVIFLVVILSWIPVFDVRKEPIASLLRVYNKIMAPFKSIIPPIGMIDISPLIAYVILKIIEVMLVNLLMRFGL